MEGRIQFHRFVSLVQCCSSWTCHWRTDFVCCCLSATRPSDLYARWSASCISRSCASNSWTDHNLNSRTNTDLLHSSTIYSRNTYCRSAAASFASYCRRRHTAGDHHENDKDHQWYQSRHCHRWSSQPGQLPGWLLYDTSYRSSNRFVWWLWRRLLQLQLLWRLLWKDQLLPEQHFYSKERCRVVSNTSDQRWTTCSLSSKFVELFLTGSLLTRWCMFTHRCLSRSTRCSWAGDEEC